MGETSSATPPPPPPGGRWLPRKVGQLLRPGKPQLNVGAGCAVAVVNTMRSLVPGRLLIVIMAMLVSMVRDSADATVSPAVCLVCCVSMVASLVSVVLDVLAQGGLLSSSP